MLSNTITSGFNKVIENYLGVDDISFQESIYERCEYVGTQIKRSYGFRKEDELTANFPKYITCLFSRNGKRHGIKVKTENFINEKKEKFTHLDTVDIGDDMIFYDGNKPVLLPYTFIINTHEMNTARFVKYLYEKINLE